MRKIVIISILSIFFYFTAQAQSYPIKETFDQVVEPNYASPSSAYSYTNSNNAWYYDWGWNLLSYLRTYQATEIEKLA